MKPIAALCREGYISSAMLLASYSMFRASHVLGVIDMAQGQVYDRSLSMGIKQNMRLVIICARTCLLSLMFMHNSSH